MRTLRENCRGALGAALVFRCPHLPKLAMRRLSALEPDALVCATELWPSFWTSSTAVHRRFQRKGLLSSVPVGKTAGYSRPRDRLCHFLAVGSTVMKSCCGYARRSKTSREIGFIEKQSHSPWKCISMKPVGLRFCPETRMGPRLHPCAPRSKVCAR